MSPQAAIAKLHSPLKDLVTGAIAAQESSSSSASVFGHSEKEKAEVVQWLEKVASGEAVKTEGLKDLDAELTPKTYIISNYLTAADVALYGALHPIFSQLQPTQYYSHPCLTRYFDHIQTRPSVRKSAESLSPAFPLVAFDLENTPKLERKADPPKQKKEKAPKPDAAPAPPKPTAAAAAAPKADAPPSAEAPAQKTQKKEKKEKKPQGDNGGAPAGGKGKGGGGNAKAAPAAADAGEPVPSMIDLRVGRILEISVHPDADGLYVEKIDFGEEEPRTVVSGLVKYIPIEKMQNKLLVGVCNLKPASMRGVKSFAMVLCATHKDGKDAGIEVVDPPAGSKPGDKIYFEGGDFENATPLSQLNPKKKIFEAIQPGFITLETKEAAWVNPTTKSVHKIRTKEGVCTAPSFVGASLS